MESGKIITPLDQVLKLVDELSPEDQDKLSETLRELTEMRLAVDEGIKQLDKGSGIPASVVFERVRKRYRDGA